MQLQSYKICMRKNQGIKNFAFLSDFSMHFTKKNCLLKSLLDLISSYYIMYDQPNDT